MGVISDDEREEKDVYFQPFTPEKLPAHLVGHECRESEKIINDLVLACESALLLRGLWTAILDPLALKGEKEELRARFKEIEAQIRRAIEAAKQ